MQKFKENQNAIKIKISDLKPHKDNPREQEDYGDSKLSILKHSLDKNGQINPIIVDEEGTILSGHRRYYAAKLLNWEFLTCDVKTGLSDFSKKAVILTTNITQKDINAWANRDMITELYWGEFLKTYKHRHVNDKGYLVFGQSIGISNQMAAKIINMSRPENKEWKDLIRENNLPAVLCDTIAVLPYDRRLRVAYELVKTKKAQPRMSTRDLQIKAKRLNQQYNLESKGIVPKHSFGRILLKFKTTYNSFPEEIIKKLTDEQKARMKESLKETFVDLYNKL